MHIDKEMAYIKQGKPKGIVTFHNIVLQNNIN